MEKTQLVIEQKIRDMMQYGHIALRQFPKAEKHVLGAEIRASMLTLLRLRCQLFSQPINQRGNTNELSL